MSYAFAYDWFSQNIPVFEKCLMEFAGKSCRAIEIGTYEGRSTTWLIDNILTHKGSSILTIDRFKQSVLDANLKATGHNGKIDFRLGMSRDVLRELPDNEFDFAYIDGSHSSCDVLEDAVMVFRRVKEGGVIGFDDYLWDDPQFNEHGTPKPAIDAFLECYKHKLEVLDHGYQVWVRKIAN